MKTRTFVLCFAFLLLLNPITAKPDTIVLVSGDTVEGTITSEKGDTVEIKVANQSHTIYSTRSYPKSDIKTITKETAEQKQEIADYEDLNKYTLTQNQELTRDRYAEGITAFKTFLAKYPKSASVGQVNDRLLAWQNEVANLDTGKVKFAGQWVSPSEKASLSAQWEKDHRLQSLTDKLTSLQRQRNELAEALATTEGQLSAEQTTLATLQDTQVPVYNEQTYQNRPDRDNRGRIMPGQQQSTTVQNFTGAYQTVPNPDRPKVLQEITFLQGQVSSGKVQLATLDQQIVDLQRQVKVALAEK